MERPAFRKAFHPTLSKSSADSFFVIENKYVKKGVCNSHYFQGYGTVKDGWMRSDHPDMEYLYGRHPRRWNWR